jgi:hypothetical protein
VHEALLRLGHPRRDEPEELGPILARRGPIRPRRRRPRGQLGEPVDELLLRLGGGDLPVEETALVLQPFDLVLEAPALARCGFRIEARHAQAAAVHRADLETARGLALDTDRVLDRARGQIGKDDGVLAGVEAHLGEARDLGARREHRYGIDARHGGHLGRAGLGGKDDTEQEQRRGTHDRDPRGRQAADFASSSRPNYDACALLRSYAVARIEDCHPRACPEDPALNGLRRPRIAGWSGQARP